MEEKLWLRGLRPRDKLRLLGIGLLQRISRFLSRADSTRGQWSRSFADRLARNAVVDVNGTEFVILDLHCFSILSEKFGGFILEWLKPACGEVFLDIGAHIGKYSLPIAKIVGREGLVIAVEPHPENYRALLRGIELNKLGNVIALNLMAWNSDSEQRLFSGPVSSQHSVKRDFGAGSIKVRGRPMDEVLREVGIRHLEWIKIDVEGAEYEVLSGLERTIDTYAPRIVTEVFPQNREWVNGFMHRHHYSVKRISPKTVHDFPEDYYCIREHSASSNPG